MSCATQCDDNEVDPNSADSVVVRSTNSVISPSYLADPHLLRKTRALFSDLTFNDSTLFELNYGPPGTADDHMEFMLQHVKKFTDPNAPGFRKTGEKQGVVYEINDFMTARHGGAGYIRLTAEINVSAELFAALMLEAKALSEMDDTVLIMDFLHAFDDQKTWLSYFRATPGRIFWDIDGLDIAGVRRDRNDPNWKNVIYQLSVSTPYTIAMLPGVNRAVDLHWGYKLTNIKSDATGTKTELVLVCQTELNSNVPKSLANYMIGSVLAVYVREAEAVANKYIKRGQAEDLIKKFNLDRLE